MIELEKIKRAKMYIEKLANGIDPITENKLPDDSVLNNERLSRCFYYVADILQQVVENNGEIKKKPESQKLPFEITNEQIKRIPLSDTPIPVSAVCENINSVIDCMIFRKLSAIKVTEWFVEKGFLKEVASPDGKGKRKTLTDQSSLLGITQEERISQYGKAYTANLYAKSAQQFIIDHIREIMAKSSEKSEIDL
jgi:hypothetical protein